MLTFTLYRIIVYKGDKMLKQPKLIVLDLDNSIYDWHAYYALSTKRSIEKASEITGIPYEKLCEEFKQILDKEDSIEYPFVIQQLPSILSHYSHDFARVLVECSEPAREQFKLAAYPHLKPYPNVLRTLQKLRADYPDTKLAVLTDAPHRIAIWRLHRLGVLNYFDGVYGLEDPKLPIIGNEVLVTRHTLLKHVDKWMYGFIGKHRILSNDYRKPSTKGLKSILIDFDIEEFDKSDILFAGDNVFKDVAAGNALGTTSCFLKFGVDVDPKNMEILKEFAPERFIHKGINLHDDNHPKPDHTLNNFLELLDIIK